MEEITIQKFISDSGLMSRRAAEKEIEQGSFKVNGVRATIGQKIDPDKDVVEYKGKIVKGGSKKLYVMLYKPRGYVTTMSDELGRKCVAELVSDVGATVYPVGRLDRDSEGMLLLTNDGEFANSVMHPRKHISKTYRVTVRSSVSKEQTEQLENGVLIDGRETLPAEVAVLEKTDARSVLQIKIFEGRNRQIRKMCEEVGLEVIRLKRTSIGSLKLGMLQPGKWRELTADEVHKLVTNTKN